MTYWLFLAGSVAGTLGLVALILWWAWRQEASRRFASTLDRRFAKEKAEPKTTSSSSNTCKVVGKQWGATIPQRVNALEQRVTALEEGQEDLERAWHSPSPALASPTTDCPWAATEQAPIPPGIRQSWRSGRVTTSDGRAARDSDSAPGTDAPK